MIDIDIKKNLGDFRIGAHLKSYSEGITALSGRSDFGKTSIMDMIVGLIRPDSGHIVIDGTLLFVSSKQLNQAPNSAAWAIRFKRSIVYTPKC